LPIEDDATMVKCNIFTKESASMSLGARRIRENQKPPNSQNKNQQIEEPHLQILKSLKNRFSEYKPYSVPEKIVLSFNNKCCVEI